MTFTTKNPTLSYSPTKQTKHRRSYSLAAASKARTLKIQQLDLRPRAGAAAVEAALQRRSFARPQTGLG